MSEVISAKLDAAPHHFALETLGPQPAPYAMSDFLARYRDDFGGDGIHAEVARLSRA